MKRYFWLHPLRGFAALCVILLHCYWSWSFYDALSVRKAYLFVDFFFALSGFVISYCYYDNISNAMDILVFIKKRLIRLRIQYFMSGFAWVAAIILFEPYAHKLEVFESSLYYFSFLDIWRYTSNIRINPVAWSVMAEIYVYSAFALLLILLKKNSHRCGAFFMITAISLLILSEKYESINILYGFGAFDRALAGFSLGSFCWVAYHKISKRWICFAALGLIFVESLALIFKNPNKDLLAIPISASFVLLFSNLNPPKGENIKKIMNLMGDISYPIYLWHFIVVVFLAKIAGKFFGIGINYISAEKFIIVNPAIGSLFCIMAVALSFIVAYIAMNVENKLKTRPKPIK